MAATYSTILDKSGRAYFVASLGKAKSSKAYSMMDMTLYNETGKVGLVAMDDPIGKDDLGKDNPEVRKRFPLR